MRNQVVLHLVAVIIVLLIMWGITMNPSDVQQHARNILGFNAQIHPRFKTAPKPELKCGLSKACPPDHYAVHISSGAANVVGPKICFDGKIIMSHVRNNVGPGLNIVVVNGETGVVEKFAYLNMKIGNKEDILAYLKDIKPGMIVLVASFEDVTTKMTKEMRELLAGMGSTLIDSLKSKDSWVFAGRAGSKDKSRFEKHAVDDPKTNKYEGWPERVELGGCFPKTISDKHKP